MKSFKFLSLFLFAFAIAACSSDSDNGGGIKLKDTPKEITFYADGENTGNTKGITFTATGNWSAIATDQLPTYSRGPIEWIKISPSSGGAGTFTINITLETNNTGKDRTAYIMINCDGTDIAIKITQKGTNANGDTPTPGRLNMRPVSRISYEEEGTSPYEGVYDINFKYDTEGRISEMWCKTKGYMTDPDRTSILKLDYTVADELRITNTEYGTWYVSLDKQGRATRAYCPESKEEYKFGYNAAGRLAKAEFTDLEDNYENYMMKIAYTDGLMTGFEQEEDGELFFKEDYNINKMYPNGLMNYTADYDFNALMLFDLWKFEEDIIAPLYLMRYLGNTEDCLYMQIHLESDEDEPTSTIKAYYEPNTTYNETSVSFSMGLASNAEFGFNGNSPVSISWNKPFTKTVTTWVVTTGDRLIDPAEPRLGYQYTVSDRQSQTSKSDGLHRYTISYK